MSNVDEDELRWSACSWNVSNGDRFWNHLVIVSMKSKYSVCMTCVSLLKRR